MGDTRRIHPDEQKRKKETVERHTQTVKPEDVGTMPAGIVPSDGAIYQHVSERNDKDSGNGDGGS